jgi:hypothetical protein
MDHKSQLQNKQITSVYVVIKVHGNEISWKPWHCYQFAVKQPKMQFFVLWPRWSGHFSYDLATDNLGITGSGSKVEYQVGTMSTEAVTLKQCPQGQVPLHVSLFWIYFCKGTRITARSNLEYINRSHGTSVV